MSESKRAILARRARFVAAALAATLPVAGCEKDKPPKDDESAEPMACLKVAVEPGGGGKGGKGGSEVDAGAPETGPVKK